MITNREIWEVSSSLGGLADSDNQIDAPERVPDIPSSFVSAGHDGYTPVEFQIYVSDDGNYRLQQDIFGIPLVDQRESLVCLLLSTRHLGPLTPTQLLEAGFFPPAPLFKDPSRLSRELNVYIEQSVQWINDAFDRPLIVTESEVDHSTGLVNQVARVAISPSARINIEFLPDSKTSVKKPHANTIESLKLAVRDVSTELSDSAAIPGQAIQPLNLAEVLQRRVAESAAQVSTSSDRLTAS